MARSVGGQLILRIGASIAVGSLTYWLSPCGASSGGLSSSIIGRMETTDSGAVVLRAGRRPVVSLVYPNSEALLSRVLGVSWDGRIWYASAHEEEQTEAGREMHYTWSIDLVSPKGARRRLVSFPRDAVCLGGSLSPDAKHLTYALREEPDGKEQVWTGPISVFVMDSDGSGRQELVRSAGYAGEAPGWVYRVSWSPDSTRIAVPMRSDGRNRIALVSISDGSTEYLPTPEWADVTCPDWSPDGHFVAYSFEDRRWKPERGEGTDWTSFGFLVWVEGDEEAERRAEAVHIRPAAIWTTDVRSGETRQLTKMPSVDTVNLLPRWSPGGTRIAYSRWHWGHEFGDMHYWWLDLRCVQADGTEDQAIEDPAQRSDWGRAGSKRQRATWRGCRMGGGSSTGGVRRGPRGGLPASQLYAQMVQKLGR